VLDDAGIYVTSFRMSQVARRMSYPSAFRMI